MVYTAFDAIHYGEEPKVEVDGSVTPPEQKLNSETGLDLESEVQAAKRVTAAIRVQQKQFSDIDIPN